MKMHARDNGTLEDPAAEVDRFFNKKPTTQPNLVVIDEPSKEPRHVNQKRALRKLCLGGALVGLAVVVIFMVANASRGTTVSSMTSKEGTQSGSSSEQQIEDISGHNAEVDSLLRPNTQPNFFATQYEHCIPKECSEHKHFIHEARALQNRRGFTLLATFPGAGSTWSRSIIEEGTRIYTGSAYPNADKLLLKDGFMGESVSAFENAFPVLSAIKTHFPMFTVGPSVRTHFVIQILRSPLDALFSEFNREYSEGADSHISTATRYIVHREFPTWFQKRAPRYKDHVKFWDGPRFWERDDAKIERDGVTSFLFERQIFVDGKTHELVSNRTVPVLVMFYEDLVTNLPEASRRIFTFLKDRFLGDAMPSVETAVMCALKNAEQESLKKRPHPGKPYNPYLDGESDFIKHGVIKRFCESVKDYWYDEKWGSCNDGALQSTRLVSRPLPSLPQDPCED